MICIPSCRRCGAFTKYNNGLCKDCYYHRKPVHRKATVYGQLGTEKELLKNCPDYIKKFEDIKPAIESKTKELNRRKDVFSKNLPGRISKEEGRFNFLKIKRKETEDYWNERINRISNNIDKKKKQITENKKIHLSFALLKDYMARSYRRNFSMKSDIESADIKIKMKNDFIHRLKNEPNQMFEYEERGLISDITELEDITKSIYYSGCHGERLVLKELELLNNKYHIFCDLQINLGRFIRHRGKKNLKTAQMDFVVISNNGVFVIEVKNWSDYFLRNYRGIRPHEQVDRAGLVLYVNLNNRIRFRSRIIKVLVPVKKNLHYDPNYKHVLVSNVKGIRSFIQNNRPSLSDEEVDRIVSILR